MFFFLIADAPLLTFPSTSITVIDTNPLTVAIQVDSNPFPNTFMVTTPNEGAVVPNISSNQTAAMVMISYANVVRDNHGQYNITASNAVGSVSAEFEIIVLCKSCTSM